MAKLRWSANGSPAAIDRPVLSFGYAIALLEVGELEAVEDRLPDAEWWLNPAVDMNERLGTEMVVVDEEQVRSLPGKIATIRAYHVQALGDLPNAVMYAQQALDLLPEDDFAERGRASAFLGVAYWASGELEMAQQAFANFMTNMRLAGNILVAISGTFLLADIRMAQGRLHEAVRSYEHSLELATAQGEPVLQGTADLYVGLGELQCEQGDLKAASQNLLTSKKLNEQGSLPELQFRSCVAIARIRAAQRDLDGALDQLHEAEHVAILSSAPDVRPVAALKTQLWVTQGKLTDLHGNGPTLKSVPDFETGFFCSKSFDDIIWKNPVSHAL